MFISFIIATGLIDRSIALIQEAVTLLNSLLSGGETIPDAKRTKFEAEKTKIQGFLAELTG
jgi:hypothetical protein